MPRERAHYGAIGRGVVELDADIAAIQEVENEAAARRVFPAPDWHVEMSSRPATGLGHPCVYRPGARLGHLATGFAVRRGVAYRRNGDLDSPWERGSAPALGNRYNRGERRPGLAAAVGPPRIRVLGFEAGPG